MNKWRLKRISKRRSNAPVAYCRKFDRQIIDLKKTMTAVYDLFFKEELKPFFGRHKE